MTYASATTITVASGAAAKFAKGDKIKLTQTTAKYFYVVSIADTVLTVTGGSDYTVANAAITSPFYSHASSPIGFPKIFNYTVALTNVTIGNGFEEGSFSIEGGQCKVSALLVMGSTTSITGVVGLGSPVASGMGNFRGQAWCYNSGVGFSMNQTYISGVVMSAYIGDGTGSSVDATHPFTFGTADQIMMNLTYVI